MSILVKMTSPSLPVEAVKCGIAHVKLIWGAE